MSSHTQTRFQVIITNLNSIIFRTYMYSHNNGSLLHEVALKVTQLPH